MVGGDAAYPSWVELSEDGGRFVGQVGSARPLGAVSYEPRLQFSLPPQYESRKDDLIFTGQLEGAELRGETTSESGEVIPWRGKRAPELRRRSVQWDEPQDLLAAGRAGWRLRWPEQPDHWAFEAEGLVNSAVGSDLVTVDLFSDFRLEVEYSYPSRSNSGIYLRGRYEFQIVDDYGAAPHVGGSGAVYGFLAPTSNVIRPAGERNRLVITLVGRWIEAVLNDEKILDGEIPGITGGALDSEESHPGPLLLQGDHGPVTFHRLLLTPAHPANLG